MPRKVKRNDEGERAEGAGCRHCGSCLTKVVRIQHVGSTTIRYRRCLHCNGTTRTAERTTDKPSKH